MITIIGTAGLVLLLSAFFFNLLGWLGTETVLYNVLNIAGSVLLTFYAVKLDSIPFLVLELTWGLLALYKLLSLLLKKDRSPDTMR